MVLKIYLEKHPVAAALVESAQKGKIIIGGRYGLKNEMVLNQEQMSFLDNLIAIKLYAILREYSVVQLLEFLDFQVSCDRRGYFRSFVLSTIDQFREASEALSTERKNQIRAELNRLYRDKGVEQIGPEVLNQFKEKKVFEILTREGLISKTSRGYLFQQKKSYLPPLYDLLIEKEVISKDAFSSSSKWQYFVESFNNFDINDSASTYFEPTRLDDRRESESYKKILKELRTLLKEV